MLQGLRQVVLDYLGPCHSCLTAQDTVAVFQRSKTDVGSFFCPETVTPAASELYALIHISVPPSHNCTYLHSYMLGAPSLEPPSTLPPSGHQPVL